MWYESHIFFTTNNFTLKLSAKKFNSKAEYGAKHADKKIRKWIMHALRWKITTDYHLESFINGEIEAILPEERKYRKGDKLF